MKAILTANSDRGQNSLVAQFGDARLVRRLNGSIRLAGGSEEERAQAHEWIVRFLRQAHARETIRQRR